VRERGEGEMVDGGRWMVERRGSGEKRRWEEGRSGYREKCGKLLEPG